MDILTERPATVLEGRFNGAFGYWLLALPERHKPEISHVETDAVVLAQLLSIFHRVHTSRQDEEDGGRWRHVLERTNKIEGLGRDILYANDILHV